MPHNLTELEALLSRTSQVDLDALGQIVGAPFGNTPKRLCDHLSFLRGGALGQLFCSSYKQFVTDAADRVGIDWAHIAPNHSAWDALSAEQIEDAIVREVGPQLRQIKDVMPHEPVQTGLRILLDILTRKLPGGRLLQPLLRPISEQLVSLFSTDWGKIASAIIYINQAIRGKAIKVS